MVNQGNETEIMYLDLYKGLGLTSDDLTKYDSPLMEPLSRWKDKSHCL